MLSRRLLSAALGIPLLVLVVAKVDGRGYDVVVAILLLLATAELLSHAAAVPRAVSPWLGGVAAGAFALTAHAGMQWPAAVLSAFLVVALLCATLESRRESAFATWFLTITIALYVGWLGQYLVLLRQVPHGRSWVFFALFTTFASDTGAYFVGRVAGRHGLAPTISPAKTIEGALGGLFVTALAAILLNLILGLRHSLPAMLAIGLGCSIAAQAGDLAESALKRSLNLKDAGGLVPGHGGLLDRLDSLLLVGPVIYYVVKWISL